MNSRLPIVLLCSILMVTSCVDSGEHSDEHAQHSAGSLDVISKPYARYWWFASEVQEADVRFNLEWLKANGFGGVELAWVYPRNAMDRRLDTAYTPRQEWLSPEWRHIVEFAQRYADSIGLACDITMGTLWPFGDSQVGYEQATQQFGSTERQTITKSWEYPLSGYVVDHLDSSKYMPYFRRMLAHIPVKQRTLPQAIFVDSWEVHSENLWADGFSEDFIETYGYDISPLMESLYRVENKQHLYDYMKLLSSRVVSFYEDYDRLLNAHGLYSRGQCSGAPCDIISAYARLDIPEGEAMLYEPEYNSIPASASLLTGKSVVSAEAFTCLYGWPRDYIRREQIADLKLVADALFANGVNQLVWHGKPHNPAGQDTVSFFASVHVGRDGALAAHIPAFNQYLTDVSRVMKRGRTYSDVAVYLPTEDAWISGTMPRERQFIWAWGWYEMRYVYFPEEVRGHHPIWINSEFLSRAHIENGEMRVGNARFSSLYVDAEYLDYDALRRIVDLAKDGLPVTMKRKPKEAGTRIHKNWDRLLKALMALPEVSSRFEPGRSPLIRGTSMPPYWAREDGEALYVFFAAPETRGLTFPLFYGQSYREGTVVRNIEVHYGEKSWPLELRFAPHEALLYRIDSGGAQPIDIVYRPPRPRVEKRPENYSPRWIVKGVEN